MGKKISQFSSVLSIIGTLIGAGFASGREIINFFFNNHKVNIVFCALFLMLIYFSIIFLLKIGKKHPSLIHLNTSIYKKFQYIPTFIYLTIYFITVSSMFAAIQYLCNLLSHSWIYFIILMLIFITISNGFNSIVKLNTIFTPILIIYLTILPISFISKTHTSTNLITTNFNLTSFTNTLLYTGMNIATAIAVILPIGAKTNPKKHKFIALFSTLIISIIFLIMVIALVNLPNIQQNTQMPILNMQPQNLKLLTLILLLIATTTTLVSCAYPLVEFSESIIPNKYIATTIIIIPTLLVACMGFSNIIAYLYPIMGILGIVHLLSLGSYKILIKLKTHRHNLKKQLNNDQFISK